VWKLVILEQPKATTTIKGGGLYLDNLSTVTLSGLRVAGNSADGEGIDGGAGAYITSVQQVTISDSTFSGNIASNLGGGLYIVDSEVLLSDSSLSDNRATYGGGAIYLEGLQSKLEEWARLEVYRTSFSANEGGNAGGAVLATENTEVNFTDSTFSENISDYGGSVETFGHMRCFSESKEAAFLDSTARWRGGAISVLDDGDYTSEGCTISGSALGGQYHGEARADIYAGELIESEGETYDATGGDFHCNANGCEGDVTK